MDRMICIAGPTASGKTELAVALALALEGEVVSCDSMQVYRHMNIGTAKPTLEERRGVPHHMLDVAEPEEPMSVGKFVGLAAPVVADILARGEDVDRCIRLGQDRTEADREFHAAIVRAPHNSFMMRLLPMINQAVAAAIASGQHKDQLAEDTRKDHALLMDFFRKRDAAGAGHAMAIHMHHSIDVMGLGTQ